MEVIEVMEPNQYREFNQFFNTNIPCRRIADASHNLPNVLAEGGHNSPIAFLLHDVPRLKELLRSVRSY